MSNHNIFFTHLYQLDARHTKIVSSQDLRSNIEAKVVKRLKKYKKKLSNSHLKTNQKEFCGYLAYLWSLTHLSHGISFLFKL